MDAIASIMNVFIFVFCFLFVNIDKTVFCVTVKSILKSLSLSLKSYSSYMCDKIQPKLLKLWGIPSQGS